MSHPFGDLLNQHLHRKHGLSQSKLAAGILQEPAIITRMCKGERLTGPQARERVLAIIGWLHQQGALETPEEANTLLDAAGLAPLQETHVADATLLHQITLIRKAPSGALAHSRLPSAQAYPQPEFELVGRNADLHTLHLAWQAAAQGRAQMVLIAGEAGIGKTRLAEALREEAASLNRSDCIAHTRCYALEARLAYAPLADWLRSTALAASVNGLNAVWRGELVRLLPELLIADRTLPAPQPIAERWQLKQMYEALLQAFVAAQQPAPLLLVLDDLQWCDAETLDWLRYALQAALHLKLLVVGTVRDAELSDEHPLHKLTRSLLRDGQLTQIQLAPLSLAEAAHLGAAVTPQQQWNAGADQTKQLLQDCAGNPLFIIESLRARQNGAANTQREQPGHTNLPPKVYAVIQERLTQLSPLAREMAELGAVIGRAFDVHLLAQASQRDEVDVAKALDELWRRKIARNPDAKRYDFSHDRIRDVAYAEIGPAKQTLLHGCVAQALQAVHGNQLESVYGELAEHQLRAGNLVQALANFRAAAATAKALLAHVELVRYLEKAIAVTHLDTHNDSFRSAEIDVWIDLSFARVRIYDFASDPVYQASLTANKLASQFGSASQKSQAFQALGVVTRNRGQWRDARRYDDLMLPLVNHEGNLETAGHMVGLYGITLYHFGEFESARGYLEQSLKLHDRSISIKPWEPGSPPRPNLLRMAKCLWMLGFPDQACACCDEAVQIASGYPATSWGTRDFGAMLGIYMRDVERVDALSQTMLELSNKYEFPFYQRAARMFQGWVMAQRGDAATGAMWVRDAVDHHRNLGIRMFEPFWRAVLAEALISAGKIEDALCEINEAIAYSETCGNTYWTGHLLTLKGDCLLTLTGSASSAEVWYQQALDLTQTQKAKSLELRAATKLARLWQSQDRVAQARQLLAPIYNWFTEGFGTPDLVEAKALLDELA